MHITTYGVSTTTPSVSKKLNKGDAQAVEQPGSAPQKVLNFRERRHNKERRQERQDSFKRMGKRMDLRQGRDRRAINEGHHCHIDISA